MDRSELLSHVDHTLLRPDATWGEIRQLRDEALKYHTASVCVPPSYVTRCANYLRGRIPVCTVVGFPNGYNTTRKTIGDPEEPLLNQALRLICPQAFPQPASASTTTPETSLTPVGEPSYIQAFQNKHCKYEN